MPWSKLINSPPLSLLRRSTNIMPKHKYSGPRRCSSLCAVFHLRCHSDIWRQRDKRVCARQIQKHCILKTLTYGPIVPSGPYLRVLFCNRWTRMFATSLEKKLEDREKMSQYTERRVCRKHALQFSPKTPKLFLRMFVVLAKYTIIIIIIIIITRI